MKNKQRIIIPITLIITVVGLYAYKEFNRKNKDLGKVRPDVHIRADSLIKSFESDEASATATFLTKKKLVLAVTGRVKKVMKDEMGYYTITMGDVTSMSSVRCSMDSLHARDAITIGTGDSVTIQGAISGFNKDDFLGSDVLLNRCVIIH
ncbi:MAG: hypothetical protein QM764_20835 [Chitinophagaceae bacterium]